MSGWLGRLGSLDRRSREPEILDRPDLDDTVLARSYRLMCWANALLGGWRILARFLGDLWSRPARYLDVGCGGGDALRLIARASRRRGGRPWVVGVEISAPVLRLARRWTRDPDVRFVRADGRRLPFRQGTFDAVFCSLVFHHLDEKDAACVLAQMARVARRVVVNDLQRNRRAFLWAWLLTALLGDAVARVDGPRSVERSFTREEILAVARAAGVAAHYHPGFGHRFALVAYGEPVPTRSSNA